MQVLRRPDWHGSPVDLGELFALTKDRHRARCMLHTHQFGWELRMHIGQEIMQSQVCLAQDEVLDTSEQWKGAMIEKGWQ